MSQSEPEHKPIVGDDGELIEDDTNIDLAAYYEYVAYFTPRPTFFERIRRVLSPSARLGITLALLLMAFTFWGNSTPKESTVLVQGTSSGKPSTRQLTPTNTSLPTARPTRVVTMEPTKFYLPESGATVQLPVSNVTDMRWSPNGKMIAMQNATGTSIWNLGINYYYLPALSYFSVFDWAPDSNFLYVNRYIVSNPPQRALLSALRTYDSGIFNYAPTLKQPVFLKDGAPKMVSASRRNQIALLAGDGLSISITDANQPDWMVTQSLETPAFSIEWLGNGTWLAIVTDTGIWKWRPDHPTLDKVLEGRYQHVSWSPYGQNIAVTQDLLHNGIHQPMVSMFDGDGSKQIWTQPLEQNNLSIDKSTDFNIQVAWSPDGKHIATVIDSATTLDIRDAKTGLPIQQFHNLSGIKSIAWSPDGQYLAIGGVNSVTIWSLQ